MNKFILFLLSISFFSWSQNNCQYRTKHDLLKYINEFTGKLRPNSNATYNSNQNRTSFSEFLNVYKKCEAYINTNQLSACFNNLKDAANMSEKRAIASRDRGMGFEVTKKEYFENTPPEAISIPADLKNILDSEGNTWNRNDNTKKHMEDEIRAKAAQKGWKVFKYRSRTVGNPGPTRSYNRILIAVPGNPYDKWIQLTVGENGRENTPERLIDFISVDKTQKPKKIYFNQFWRDANGRKPVRRDDPHGGSGGFDNCYSCHPNGMRELSPSPGSYSKEDAPNLDGMNKMMADYTPLDWGENITPNAYGPHLGEEQGCIRCHNNGEGDPKYSRGAINSYTDTGHIGHKITGDLSMPVTELKPEADLKKYFKDIPYLFDDESQRKKFSDYVATSSSERKSDAYKVALNWLKNNKRPGTEIPYLSEDKFNDYMKILVGSDDYPSCFGKPDCYRGMIKNANENLDQFYANYEQKYKNWAIEKCDSLEETQPEDIVDERETERDGAIQGTNEGGNESSNQ